MSYTLQLDACHLSHTSVAKHNHPKTQRRKRLQRVYAEPNSNQPTYVIKCDGGYYHSMVAWATVPKAKAERLTHRAAVRIAAHLKRLGFIAEVE